MVDTTEEHWRSLLVVAGALKSRARSVSSSEPSVQNEADQRHSIEANLLYPSKKSESFRADEVWVGEGSSATGTSPTCAGIGMLQGR